MKDTATPRYRQNRKTMAKKIEERKRRQVLSSLTTDQGGLQQRENDEIPPGPRRYTVQEAADILGVNKFTIYRWKSPKVGLIEACRDGRGIYFTAQQIRECQARRAAGMTGGRRRRR